jgi:hypothetical protein
MSSSPTCEHAHTWYVLHEPTSSYLLGTSYYYGSTAAMQKKSTPACARACLSTITRTTQLLSTPSRGNHYVQLLATILIQL